MGTIIVSGRVDALVKERADGYIKAAGLSVGEVIKRVWEHIARTGEVPDTLQAESGPGRATWEAFLTLKGELTEISRTTDILSTLTDAQLHDLKAQDLLEEYEQL